MSAWRAIGLALPVLILGACLTGFAPIFVRLAAADGAGPFAAAFWRFAFSLPALALWAAMETRSSASPQRGGGVSGLILLSGLLFAGDLATWHSGIVRTDVANATLLVNLTPILSARRRGSSMESGPRGASSPAAPRRWRAPSCCPAPGSARSMRPSAGRARWATRSRR